MCAALYYYTCVYIYGLVNSCGYWTLNKYCYYYLLLLTPKFKNLITVIGNDSLSLTTIPHSLQYSFLDNVNCTKLLIQCFRFFLCNLDQKYNITIIILAI